MGAVIHDNLPFSLKLCNWLGKISNQKIIMDLKK
jgi:hypothetical protein